MTFPTINVLADLVPHVADNPQIRVKTEPNGHTVVCYMLQDEDTFGDQDGFAQECRGITFRPDGRVSARTLHKFFNVGEREDTQPWALDWSRVVRIMDKRDGSMVTPVWVNGELTFKTKKSFDTKEAALALDIARATQHGYAFLLKMAELGLTPTFEVTSPKLPIVLVYERDELTLLHVRENVSGRYLTETELVELCSPFPLVENIIEKFKDAHMVMGCFDEDRVSWDLLRQAAETTTGIEGWVIQFDDGEMVKLKTKWYCDLHHAVTFTRWRDIARAVCEDQSDDLKGAFALTGRSIEPILTVERQIKLRLEIVKAMVKAAVEAGLKDGLDAKGMALQWKGDQYFGLIMQLFRGKEPDYMAWYVKNHLDTDWDLAVVEVNVPQ